MTPKQNVARSVLAVTSFAAIAAGCWMWFPPMGLIVPGSIVFTGLLYSHLRGTETEPTPVTEDTDSAQ